VRQIKGARMRQEINKAIAGAEEKRAVEIIAMFLHSAWMDWAGTVLEQEPISEERAQRWVKYMVPGRYKGQRSYTRERTPGRPSRLLATAGTPSPR